MTEDPPSAPAPEKISAPDLRVAQRWNMVWVVPVVALLLGAWLIYRNFSTQGPVANVRFDTADGIFAGKTEVRCRSVKVGIVKKVKLADDLKSVLTYLELDDDAERLLRDGTHFWVVKPRLSLTGFSGAETLITGAYIELDPGPAEANARREFVGLETPLATRSGLGRRLALTADEVGSLAIGSPVYYRGFEVGRVEGRSLDPGGQKITYQIFITSEHAHLVTENTRFWNTSGIDITAGPDGLKLRTPSFQAMVSGGVSFGLAEGMVPGKPTVDGMVYPLYRDEEAARQASFHPTIKILLLFEQTVRGLAQRAPVEFRGIPIGRVADISFDLMPGTQEMRVPVLIEIDPALMRPEVAPDSKESNAEFLRKAVAHGLRAALKNSSLITGALYVDLDYYPESPRAELGQVGEYIAVPTVSSGLAQLETKLTAIMDKIQALPLDQTMTAITGAADEAKTTLVDSRAALRELQETSAAARKILSSPAFRELPADLRATLDGLQSTLASVGPDGAMQGDLLRTLDELRASLRSIKAMTNTLEDRPNSLLFGRESSGNPQPKAPGRR